MQIQLFPAFLLRSYPKIFRNISQKKPMPELFNIRGTQFLLENLLRRYSFVSVLLKVWEYLKSCYWTRTLSWKVVQEYLMLYLNWCLRYCLPKLRRFASSEWFIFSRLSRSSHQVCSVRKGFLEILQNSQENTCARVSFLIKLQAACNFIKKETLPQVFSCEFCEMFKNNFFIENLGVTASDYSCY